MKKKLALGVLGALVFYLLSVAVWAWFVTPQLVAKFEAAHPPANLAALPPETVPIVLRVEDPSFPRHIGVDPFTPGQGLVTLTQALAREVYVGEQDADGFARLPQSVFRFVWSHAKKVDIGRDVMALVLDRRLSKQRQLALFLGGVYLGRGVYGIPAASRSRFGKEPSQLTHEELVTLTALMIAPNAPPDAVQERAHRIERLLRNECAPRGLLDTRLEGCR
ncbi:MAG TPA: transglycosylase domain-containing protein [Thermoanaerobaculia bacterium]|nr:transglycosylase domain-containing protein [Thermoanaerobaculia bacterium]